MGRQRQISEFEASLVCRASSRTARAVAQRNTVLKKTNKQNVIVKSFNTTRPAVC